jgi:hypothetical protein
MLNWPRISCNRVSGFYWHDPGRLLADPELPNKVAAGRLEDIAPCTAVSPASTEYMFTRSGGDPVARRHASLTREAEYKSNRQLRRKKVWSSRWPRGNGGGKGRGFERT